MNILTPVRYHLWQNKRALFIFYGIIYVIYAMAVVATLTISSISGPVSMSGIEFASMIFIFILGLSSFSESFGMFLQNGMSRRTLFISTAYSFVIVAAIMAAVDSINGLLANFAFKYQGMFLQTYHPRYGETAGSALQVFEGLLWYLFLYSLLAMIGLFIGTLYYRMDKRQKILVSVGVPTLALVFLPLFNRIVTNGALFSAIGNFLYFVQGFESGHNPYYAMTTYILSFAFFGCLSFLLMRRAVVRN